MVNGKFSRSAQPYHNSGRIRIKYINGQFHTFLGHNKVEAHSIWNEQRDESQEVHRFEEIEDAPQIRGCTIFPIKSRNMVLIINSELIYEYHLSSNKCIKSDIDLRG